MSPDTESQRTYRVPVIDPETGDGWDVEIKAESPQKAMQKVDDGLHVASTFVRKHLEVGL